MSLSIVIGNETRTFNADGTVSVLVNGQQQQKGTGRSADDAKDSRIRYTIDGGEQDPLLAGYAFDDNNQLAVTLANDAATASAPFAFPGRILIDDNHDLIYRVVDQQGNDTTTDVTVYGDIASEENTNHLAISLARGGTTKIVGDSGIASLEAGRNDVAGFNADDLLVFHASTTNMLPGQDAMVFGSSGPVYRDLGHPGQPAEVHQQSDWCHHQAGRGTRVSRQDRRRYLGLRIFRRSERPKPGVQHQRAAPVEDRHTGSGFQIGRAHSDSAVRNFKPKWLLT